MTNPPAPSAAVAAMLNINELLEAILTQLEMKDLARCQRVCQHWRTVTQASIHMQQTLFLRPREPTEYFTFLEGNHSKPRLVKVPSVNTTPVVKVSPVFECSAHFLYGHNSMAFTCAILHKASEHMLVTQPPCNTALITTVSRRNVVLQSERGIIVGMIRRVLEKYETYKLAGREEATCILWVLGRVHDRIRDVEMARKGDLLERLPHEGDHGWLPWSVSTDTAELRKIYSLFKVLE